MKEKKQEEKIELKPLENTAEEGTNVIIKPSIEIIKFIIDSMHQYGIRGIVTNAKFKDGTQKKMVHCIINIDAEIDDVIEHEEAYTFPETIKEDNK